MGGHSGSKIPNDGLIINFDFRNTVSYDGTNIINLPDRRLATANGTPTYHSSEKSFGFNGGDDIYFAQGLLPNTFPVTVICTYRQDFSSNDQSLWGHGSFQAYGYSINGGIDSMWFETNNSSGSISDTITCNNAVTIHGNTILMIAVTANSTGWVEIYFNGVPETNGSINLPEASGAQGTIGNQRFGASSFLYGNVYSLIAYNRELSKEEVKEIYLAYNSRYE